MELERLFPWPLARECLKEHSFGNGADPLADGNAVGLAKLAVAARLICH